MPLPAGTRLGPYEIVSPIDKTSITLSEDVVTAIDKLTPRAGSRSETNSQPHHAARALGELARPAT
jgi:hypothetical protein